MIRPVAAVLFLALVPYVAAQDDKKPNLYPLTEGNKWQYVVNVMGNNVDVVTEVTASKTTKGKTKATVTAKGPDGKDIAEELTADEKGVYRSSISGVKTDRPLTIIKYPVKNGATWTEKLQINGMDATVVTEVGETEDVKVAAGKYKATPHEATIKIAGQEVKATSWYADGVGIVKQKMSFGGIDATMELKKFTKGE